MFATGTADRKFCIFEKNRHCARNAAHPTSENGKIAAFASGRPAFQKHAKHAEGSDTTPLFCMCGKPCAQSKKNSNIIKLQTERRSPAGPRRLRNSDTHGRIAVPKAFCVLREHPRPRPKAAKFAVLVPGPGRFVNVQNAPRVVIPPSETPSVSTCKPLCAILLAKASVYPLSPVKANVGRLCKKLKIGMRNGWWIKFMRQFCLIFPLCLMMRGHREPGNVCI